MKKSYLICLLFLSIFILPATAQNYSFITSELITKKQGLSDVNVIGGIVEDKYGYLWIGTADGLNRYNGIKFEIFRANPMDSNAIGENIIRGLFSDRMGRLWIKGRNIYQYDHAHERFIGYQTPSVTNLNESHFSEMFDDSEGNIWAQYNNNLDGILKLNTKTGKFTSLAIIGGRNLSFNSVRKSKLLSIDESDNFWLSMEYADASLSILTFHLKNNVVSDIQIIATNCYLISPTVDDGLHYLKTSDNIKRIISHKGDCFNYNGKKKSLDKEPLLTTTFAKAFDQTHLRNVSENNEKNAWFVSCKNSLAIFSKGSLKTIASSPSFSMISYHQDRTGIVWIGTQMGLIKVNLSPKKFYSLSSKTNNRSNIPNTMVTALCKDSRNNLWVSTYEGLYVMDLQTGSVRQFKNDPSRMHIMVNNYYFSMLEYTDGTMLCSAIGLNKIAPFDEIFEYAHPDSNDPKTINAWTLWQLHRGKVSGNYFIATQNGCCRMIPVPGHTYERGVMKKMDETFERFLMFPYEIEQDITCFSIYEDHEGYIWSGLKKGLYRYNPKNKNIKIYLPEKNNKNSINCATASCIMEDSKNRLWIGTEEGGINLFDRETEHFTHYTELDGLAGNMVWGILEDKRGNLWISTTNGLSKFNTVSKTFTNFDEYDGLPDCEFTRGTYFKDSDGRMFFGTASGVLHFDPDSILLNSTPPIVNIDRLYLFGKAVKPGELIHNEVVLEKSLNDLKEIRISNQNRDISFGFSALHFVSSHKNRYAYKLDGYDNEWNYTTSSYPMTHYTNLNPGSYKFRVRASNNDGIWNPDETILSVIVLPPLWGTWWFQILIGLACIAMLVFIFNYFFSEYKKKNLIRAVALKTGELNKQKAELEKINETKDKFIYIISHDLKSPFQAISGMSELLIRAFNQTPDPQKIEMLTVIEKASKSATELLDNLLMWARTRAGNMVYNPDSFNITDVVSSITGILSIQAGKKNISIINNTDSKSNVKADRNMIETVIRNLVMNAIKFTNPGGKIVLYTYESSVSVELIIEDNGIGMDQETKDNIFKIGARFNTKGTAGESGTGLGLVLCKEFLEINNSELHYESETGKGTRIRFSLPKE